MDLSSLRITTSLSFTETTEKGTEGVASGIVFLDKMC